MSVHLSLRVPVRRSVCVCLSVCPSVCLSICLDVYVSVSVGLKFLVRLCTDMNLKEAQEYANKLKKAEKMQKLREEVRH